MTQKTESLEILPVSKVFDDHDDHEYLVKCPHCERIRGVEKEASLSAHFGEQYQDNLCDGWFEIAEGATLVRDVEDL
jgi:hypothetical protein